jgi:hypothetical protein
VAIPGTRDALLDWLNHNPLVRKYLLYLPEKFFYAFVKKIAGGIKIDTRTGKIIEYMFGAPTKTFFVTSIL